MRNLGWAGVIFGGATCLSACFQSDTSTLCRKCEGAREDCRATVNGKPVTSDDLLALGRDGLNRRGIVLYDKNTPNKCTRATIVTLQRAGLASVDAAMWDG